MSLVATLYSRILSPLGFVVRVAVNRLGVAPVVLAAVACAAALYSWRRRPPNQGQRRGRRRPRNEGSSLMQSSNHARNPDSASPENAQDSDFSGARSSAQTVSSSRVHASASSSRKPQWLSRVRRVTLGGVCSLSQPCHLFAIEKMALENAQQLDKLSGDAMKSNQQNLSVTILPAVLPHLKSLASMFELFVVIRVDDDAMEEAVTNAFINAGFFDNGLFDSRKLVFCETDTGRISVARQIESQLHIDESFEVVLALQRFLHCVAFVSPNAATMPGDVLGRNVAKLSSMASLFS